MASLNNQFFNAMQYCCAYGASKRSYREQTGSPKADKVFSHQSYETIAKDSKDFSKFLKTKGISMANKVTSNHVKEFLEQKAETCNDNSLHRIRSSLHSLGLFCAKRYKSVDSGNYVISNEAMPDSKLPSGRKIGRPMSINHFEMLYQYVKDSQSIKDHRLFKALAMVRYAGLRINEVTHQKITDIHLDERGKFGFGYITVSNGKHGRSRDVHLFSRQAKETLKEALSLSGGSIEKDRYISCDKDTLSNNFAELKRCIGISEVTKLQGMHSIRKLFAQEFYSWYRERHTRRESIQQTNIQLGHNASRDVSELRTYVQDIY